MPIHTSEINGTPVAELPDEIECSPVEADNAFVDVINEAEDIIKAETKLDKLIPHNKDPKRAKVLLNLKDAIRLCDEALSLLKPDNEGNLVVLSDNKLPGLNHIEAMELVIAFVYQDTLELTDFGTAYDDKGREDLIGGDAEKHPLEEDTDDETGDVIETGTEGKPLLDKCNRNGERTPQEFVDYVLGSLGTGNLEDEANMKAIEEANKELEISVKRAVHFVRLVRQLVYRNNNS